MYKTSKRQRKNKRKTLRKKAIHGGNETCSTPCPIEYRDVKPFYQAVGENYNFDEKRNSDKDPYTDVNKINSVLKFLSTKTKGNYEEYFKVMDENKKLTIFSFVEKFSCCLRNSEQDTDTEIKDIIENIKNASRVISREGTGNSSVGDEGTVTGDRDVGVTETKNEPVEVKVDPVTEQITNEKNMLKTAEENKDKMKTENSKNLVVPFTRNKKIGLFNYGESLYIDSRKNDLNSIINNRRMLVQFLTNNIPNYKQVQIQFMSQIPLQQSVGMYYPNGEKGVTAFAESEGKDPLSKYVVFIPNKDAPLHFATVPQIYNSEKKGGRKTRKNKGGKSGKANGK